MGPDGPGTLSAAAKKPSLSYHPVGRGDLQDKGVVNAGASREMKPGEIHKNSRSAQLVSKGLQSDCSRSSPNRNQDLKNQGYRGAGVYHPDANSDRSASHASNRHGRKGRSSGPTELRHVSERIYHSRHQPPPLPPAAPDDPGSCLQHHQSRHGHCHYPNNSVGAGAATGPRSGRSSSHSAIHSERGASRSCFNARASSIPIACHENTPCRNSQFSRHESPLQSEHGAQGSSNPTYTSSAQTFCPYGAWSSPVRRHSADAGDGAASGSAVGEGEMNRWAQGGQLRETVITDRLVLLKAEFLELHDLLLESDFLWEQCQKFHDLLKVELDELMFAPLPKRYPLAQPLAR